MQIFTQCFILFDHMSMHWLTPCGAQASCPAVQQSRRPPWRLSSSAYSTRSKLLLGGFNPCHTSNISSAAGCSAYHIPYKNSYRVYIGYTLHIIIIVHMKSGYIWLRSVILRLSIVSLTGCFLSWRLLMQCINCRRSSSQIEPFGSPIFFCRKHHLQCVQTRRKYSWGRHRITIQTLKYPSPKIFVHKFNSCDFLLTYAKPPLSIRESTPSQLLRRLIGGSQQILRHLTLHRVWLQVAMKIRLMVLPQSTYCS